VVRRAEGAPETPGAQRNNMRHRTPTTLATLSALDLQQLQRNARTLHRWAAAECNGDIERDEETNITYRARRGTRLNRCADLQAISLKQVAEICQHAKLYFYHQSDPRGLSLYISTAPLNTQNYHQDGTPVWYQRKP
jgi:hypothetical protein